MIEVAVVLSGVVRHWPDFFIILLLLAANATIGFWEERQAGNAIDALKAKLAIKAHLMLSVAGHLTVFQTRTRGPWWSTRPAWILLGAVCGTQGVATLIAVYGVGLVTPLGWMYAGIVWAYAFACFLITDPVKLLAYKVLDTAKADTRPSAESEPKLDAKAQLRQVTETVKADAKPGAQSAPELQPRPESGSQPTTQPVPQPAAANAKITALLDTKLGDVLLAAVLKDPADGGRLIAKAISDAE